MHNKTLVLTLLSILTLLSSIPMTFAHNAPMPAGYDPYHGVFDTIGGPETLDPAWAYDTASGEMIFNVYETLITFNHDESLGPYRAGDVNTIVPMLATTVPTQGNGLIVPHDPPLVSPNGDLIYSTWTFPIRAGVQFHTNTVASPQILTAADAEYSIERVLVQDRTDGPQWMLWEPLLGIYSAVDPVTDPNFGARIDYAVQSSGNNVIFNLGFPYPELAFKQILAQTWGSIMSKAWAVAEGDFDGNWAAGWATIYATWHDPPQSFLEDAIGHAAHDGGTGPYEYDYWEVDVARSIVANDGAEIADVNDNPISGFQRDPLGPTPAVYDSRPEHNDITPESTYWDGWPARVSRDPTSVNFNHRKPRYLERDTWYDKPTWASRYSDALTGAADLFATPRANRDSILGVQVASEAIRAYWRAPPNGIFALSASGLYMTLNASSSTSYFGTAPYGYASNPASWGANKAPLDVFTDINARRGIAYAFDYADFIATTQLGEAVQPADPVIPGLAYDNVKQQMYTQSIGQIGDTKSNSAEYYLKLAWGGVDNAPLGPPWGPEDVPGTLWTQGFSLSVTFNTGNVAREYAANSIVATLNAMNPGKFNLVALGLLWGTQYLPAMVAQELGMFNIGWLADYADPHDFVFPFQHSEGTFSYDQAYNEPVVDAIIEAGIGTGDDAAVYDGSLDNPNGDGLANLDNKPAGDWHTWPTTAAYYLANPLDVNYPRRAIYYALQEMWYEDVITVLYVQGLVRGFEQWWFHDWYYNSLFPGIYNYDLYKSLSHYGDINFDMAVNILDVSSLSSSWTLPRGPIWFRPEADINGGIGGTTGSFEGSIIGMPNGLVQIDDLSLVSANWDNAPQGPGHP